MGYINSKRYGSAVQLYKKSSGDISYYITYKDEDNKLKRIKIGDKSKGITEPFCNQKRNEVVNTVKLGGEMPIKHKKPKMITLDEIAQQYFDYLHIYSSKGTIKETTNRYKNHLKNLFGYKSIDRITASELESLQREKIKFLSPSSVNSIVDLFSTILNYGIKRELCQVINPAVKIRRFKVNNARERFLTKEEIKELFEEIDDNELLTLFLKFALTTGGRLETILHIQKKDIDLSTKIITLNDLKNKETYRGFLTADLVNLLKGKIIKYKANDYVVSLDKEKTTPRQIQCRLKPKMDKLFNKGLDSSDRKNRVVIHSLRHTFASHLAINGTPLFTIQKLLNHKDIQQTMRYAKLSPDSSREFIDDLYK